MKTSDRYREALAALSRANGARVCRVELDLSDLRHPVVIATASTKQAEEWAVAFAIESLIGWYREAGLSVSEPQRVPVDEDAEDEVGGSQ